VTEKPKRARKAAANDAIDARITAGDKDDLVALLEDPALVKALTPDQQVALAKHRSVDVPRALAKHGADLTEETQRLLAASRIFTARRELVKSAGTGLPSDLLDMLAGDEDAAVRNLVAKVRGTTVEKEARAPKAAPKARKHAGEGFANQPRADLLKLLENEAVVAELTPLQQTQIAQHRSVEVPRALARHAAVLAPEAQMALAESRIFTARRELVRRAGEDLPVEVLAALCEDDDSVVRALVASVWNPTDDELPEAVKIRRAEVAERIERIQSATTIADHEVDDLLRRRDERLLGEVAANRAIVESLDAARQVALAKHRSIAVPRALAGNADVLQDEAISELAQSPIFTARRALVRHGGARLSDELMALLANDEDAVVRKLVADIAERPVREFDLAELGVAELETQAADGSIDAICQLGLNAWAVDDTELARAWFERAAALGDTMAMLDLETLALESGDVLSAQEWLRRAAEAGHAGALRRYEAAPVEDAVYDGMDLSGLSFAGQDLSRASFVDANLTDADFSGSILTRAVFCGAIADGANFTGAVLNAASFGADVRDIYGAMARQIDDDNEDLQQAESDGTRLAASLRGCRFHGANASRAVFEGADLTDADFTGAILRDADFVEADLTGVISEGADVEGSFYFHANWDLSLAKGDFTNRRLPGRDFTVLQLEKPVFRFALLPGADFSGMDLSGADFTNAQLLGADFSGAILDGADFSGSTLIAATFVGAVLNGANFKTALLTVSELREINSAADEAEARSLLEAIDSMTSGEDGTDWVVLEDGERITADEVEAHLAESDRYAGLKDAEFDSAQTADALMPDWWRHDNAGKGATKAKRVARKKPAADV
jgi:uncharacterized protein YjbI with pentapeptide repeats